MAEVQNNAPLPKLYQVEKIRLKPFFVKKLI